MKSLKVSLLSFALAALSLAALALANGCATVSKDGPYKGDSFLYNADQVILGAYDTLHTFVKWEHTHRAALAGKPEIKQAADHVRDNAQRWIASAITARDAYAASPSPENKSVLEATLRTLRAALAEAARYAE